MWLGVSGLFFDNPPQVGVSIALWKGFGDGSGNLLKLGISGSVLDLGLVSIIFGVFPSRSVKVGAEGVTGPSAPSSTENGMGGVPRLGVKSISLGRFIIGSLGHGGISGSLVSCSIWGGEAVNVLALALVSITLLGVSHSRSADVGIEGFRNPSLPSSTEIGMGRASLPKSLGGFCWGIWGDGEYSLGFSEFSWLSHSLSI